jgi:Rps23 Pro-64 3,4-dihydroxylase Tpa1-like proline 4-hydroxylase
MSDLILTRQQMGAHIADRLRTARHQLADQWQQSGAVRHFFVDDLLPAEWARQIHEAFPPVDLMTLKKSLRELKYVAAQMDRYNPVLEEAIYAFQEPAVVELVGDITGLRELEPDSLLYAGGISAMTQGQYLNPHIDNSHDKFRKRYRVLNLLYYSTPEWSLDKGGNLELWPHGPKDRPTTIESRFNRLAVMVTDRGSWHSVSKIRPDLVRQCVSNYYFSTMPVGDEEYFHVTSFRGRPEQPLRDLILRADIRLRMVLRKLFPMGVKDNPHFYRKQ